MYFKVGTCFTIRKLEPMVLFPFFSFSFFFLLLKLILFKKHKFSPNCFWIQDQVQDLPRKGEVYFKFQETLEFGTRISRTSKSVFSDPRTSRILFKKLKNFPKYVLGSTFCKKQHKNSRINGKQVRTAPRKFFQQFDSRTIRYVTPFFFDFAGLFHNQNNTINNKIMLKSRQKLVEIYDWIFLDRLQQQETSPTWDTTRRTRNPSGCNLYFLSFFSRQTHKQLTLINNKTRHKSRWNKSGKIRTTTLNTKLEFRTC